MYEPTGFSILVGCLPAPIPSNGSIAYDREPDTFDIYDRQLVLYRKHTMAHGYCKPGYQKTAGWYSLRCTGIRTWQGVRTVCSPGTFTILFSHRRVPHFYKNHLLFHTCFLFYQYYFLESTCQQSKPPILSLINMGTAWSSSYIYPAY